MQDIDRGWKDFERLMKKGAKGVFVDVGVQGAEAEVAHDGKTNVEIATAHEFGGPDNNPPERSFIRATFDAGLRKYDRELNRIAKRVKTVHEARGELLLLGEGVRADIVDRIRAGIPPPLASETVVRKRGEETPLIDTGQMVGSLSAKVKP